MERLYAYAQQAEAAFALANLLRSDRVNGIVGSRRGTQVRDEDPDGPFHLKPLTRQPAIDIYGEVSDQLRITQTRSDARNVLPKIGEEHGEPLVRATEASLGFTAIARRLLNVDPVLEEVTLVELEEFASVVHAQEIPEAERLALLEAVLPSEPQPDDVPRVSTYTALLALAEGPENGAERSQVERDLFIEAIAARRPWRMRGPLPPPRRPFGSRRAADATSLASRPRRPPTRRRRDQPPPSAANA